MKLREILNSLYFVCDKTYGFDMCCVRDENALFLHM